MSLELVAYHCLFEKKQEELPPEGKERRGRRTPESHIFGGEGCVIDENTAIVKGKSYMPKAKFMNQRVKALLTLVGSSE